MPYFYRYGIGVEKEPIKEQEWLEKNAKSGNPVAEFNLAKFYSEQINGVDDYDKKSFEYMKKAADHGSSFAMKELYRYYSAGIGTNRDKDEAISCYDEYAESLNNSDDAEAIWDICLHYHDYHDYEKTKRWFDKYCSLQENLANTPFLKGTDLVRHRYSDLVKLLNNSFIGSEDVFDFLKAISERMALEDLISFVIDENGSKPESPDEQQLVNVNDSDSVFTDSGYKIWLDNVKKDPEPNISWIFPYRDICEDKLKWEFKRCLKSASKGDRNDQYWLAYMYAAGLGTEQSLESELIWFKAAADNNHPRAQFEYGLLLVNGVLESETCRRSVDGPNVGENDIPVNKNVKPRHYDSIEAYVKGGWQNECEYLRGETPRDFGYQRGYILQPRWSEGWKYIMLSAESGYVPAMYAMSYYQHHYRHHQWGIKIMNWAEFMDGTEEEREIYQSYWDKLTELREPSFAKIYVKRCVESDCSVEQDAFNDFVEILNNQEINPFLEYEIGWVYLSGVIVPKDYEKARMFLKKALLDLHPCSYSIHSPYENYYCAAHFSLGNIYYNGWGVEANPVIALYHYTKSERAGHPGACGMLGKMYLDGEGVKQDVSIAREYFTRGSFYYDGRSQYYLGVINYRGEGVVKSLDNAKKWLVLSARQEFNAAQVFLKEKFKDIEVSYYKFAQEGDPNAQYVLAHFYLNGIGVEKNKDEAIKWFNSSAKQGFSKAQCDLGIILYRDNCWKNEDFSVAKKWLDLALEQGDPYAAYVLADMYVSGKGVKVDYEKARNLYALGVENGFEPAYDMLAILYDKGWGGEPDKIAAEKLRERAHNL